MDKYNVKPLKIKDIKVTVPGSKSITNRALLMAALSEGECFIKGILFSDDSRYFLKALEDLGFELHIDEENKNVKVFGQSGNIPKKNATIYVGSAGTAARFLTAMLGMSDGEYVINASEQMKKRPMKPLFDVLKSMGSQIEFLEEENSLPVRIIGCKSDKKMRVSLDISKSTQFLSALMMIGCMCKEGLEVEITSEKKTGSYINITKNMVEEFGGKVAFDGTVYYIEPKSYSIKEYQVEPDVSAACYFYGIAAIYGCKALVYNVHFDSTQGDIRFINVLEKMGCKVTEKQEGIEVEGPSKLKGIGEVDMNNFSDQALTLANVAIFADGPITISNIAHIRGQECDRLNAIASNLKNMGINVDEREDSITIYPGQFNHADIETYEDHRVAMAFTMSGLGETSLSILNPMCCKKTFENYFDIIEGLC